LRHNADGTATLIFQGKQVTLTKKQAEKYNETFFAMHYVDNRITKLEAEIAKTTDADDKAALQAELTELRAKQAKQREYVSYEIGQDGATVNFTIKKPINVEDFKRLFYLSDGALRKHLKSEALYDGYEVDKDHEGPFYGYDDARSWGVNHFSNGVYLEDIDDAGHYLPVYSRATLSAGDKFSIHSSWVDPPSDKPWYQFW